MVTLEQRVWAYSLKHPEGFTLNLHTLKPLSTGICVAYQATQDCHSLESLEQVINHALQNEGIVGGWFNPENGRYYFDSVRVFKESEREQAEAFAKANGQIGIYKLSSKTFIEIK